MKISVQHLGKQQQKGQQTKTEIEKTNIEFS